MITSRHNVDQLGQPPDPRRVIDSTPGLIHTGLPDGYLDFFNQSWLNYLGQPQEQIQGWKWTRFIHPDDVDEMVALWRASITSGEPYLFESRVRRADGEFRWMMHHKVALRDDFGQIIKWYGTSIDIEDRVRAEEKLRRSEFYLAEGQHLAHTGSWAFDPAGFYDYWSEELHRIYGLDPSAGPPTLDQYLACVHPEDREFVAGTIKSLLADGSGCDLKKRIIRPDGELRYIRCVGVPIIEQGVLKKIIGTAIDVTDQELLNQEVRRREAYLAEAQRLSHTGSFGWRPSTGEIFWSEETFRIFEYDSKTKPTVEVVLQRVHPEDIVVVERVIERALRDEKDFDFEHRLLMPDGSVKYLHVSSRAIQAESGNVEFVGAVVDISATKQAEERVRLVINTVPGLLWSARPDGSVDFISQRCLDYTGMTLEQSLGWGWQPVLHPDDREQVVSAWRAAVAERKPHEIVHRVRRFDGEYRWCLSQANPLFDRTGRVLGWYGNEIDIHERKQAEEQLRRNAQELQRSEFYLAEGQRLGHAGSWAFNTGGYFEHWSQELFQIYGLDPQKGAPTLEQYLATIHPQDRDFMAETIRRMNEQSSGCDVKKRIIRPDGELRYIRCVGVPIIEQGVLKKIIGTAIDVTDQELLTQEVRRREAYLAEAQRLSHTGSFGWKPASGEVLWSEETHRIFELEPETKPSAHFVLSRTHPEDRDVVRQLIERATREAKDWDLEHRIVVPDGSIKHLHVVAHAVRDETTGETEYIGAVRDITANKQAEQRTRQDESELRQLMDFLPQHVFVLDAAGRLLRANRMMLDYAGRTLRELQAEGGEERIERDTYPEDLEQTLAERRRGIFTGAEFEIERRAKAKSGEFRWFLYRFKPILDAEDHVARWIVTATDIDDRKREEEEVRRENIALREEIATRSMLEEIIGDSPALQAVLAQVTKVAPTDSTVLITGETGVGKELIARAIHKYSKRASRAFLSVNCAAVPRDLIASELFGHEKGAFTGALQRRLGRFELAEAGTIFLDEVGDLPAETQVALLRVLQEHEFERVGGSRTMKSDVRVIAATNRDLQAAVVAGHLRKDLFYRLNVFPIDVPPLRKRREDIPLLVEYFIDRYARKAGRKIKSIQKKTLDALQSYSWPGNIRELQNVIERSVILCDGGNLSVDASWLTSRPQTSEPAGSHDLSERLAAQERSMIEAALRECGGQVFGPSGAAARLGMPRSTLESKIKSLKIDKQRFKT